MILFLNTGWMDFYNGIQNDEISGGGKHVENEGWGGEIYNFKKENGKVFGYVQPVIDRKFRNPSTIKLEKLGGSKDADFIAGITVVWTARDSSTRETKIIGWYKNATVFRYMQPAPSGTNRRFQGMEFGYFVTAQAKDCILLIRDERLITVKRREKNWMGQSNVWYADQNPSFVRKVLKYIAEYASGKVRPGGGKGSGYQRDLLKRLKVEQVAIQEACNYYENLGYKIKSVERENVGWDLTAIYGRHELRIEVKGLSGAIVAAELTPNEYQKLKEHKEQYRLCVVTNCLAKPLLTVFQYSKICKKWISEGGSVLNFQEVISAKFSI